MEFFKNSPKAGQKAQRTTGMRNGADFVHKLLKKRLFSSPMAFATTLAKHRESIERPRSKRDAHVMDERVLRKAILRAEEDYSNDDAGRGCAA